GEEGVPLFGVPLVGDAAAVSIELLAEQIRDDPARRVARRVVELLVLGEAVSAEAKRDAALRAGLPQGAIVAALHAHEAARLVLRPKEPTLDGHQITGQAEPDSLEGVRLREGRQPLRGAAPDAGHPAEAPAEPHLAHPAAGVVLEGEGWREATGRGRHGDLDPVARGAGCEGRREAPA